MSLFWLSSLRREDHLLWRGAGEAQPEELEKIQKSSVGVCCSVSISLLALGSSGYLVVSRVVVSCCPKVLSLGLSGSIAGDFG